MTSDGPLIVVTAGAAASWEAVIALRRVTTTIQQNPIPTSTPIAVTCVKLFPSVALLSVRATILLTANQRSRLNEVMGYCQRYRKMYTIADANTARITLRMTCRFLKRSGVQKKYRKAVTMTTPINKRLKATVLRIN